jgi:hypothetical protein
MNEAVEEEVAADFVAAWRFDATLEGIEDGVDGKITTFSQLKDKNKQLMEDLDRYIESVLKLGADFSVRSKEKLLRPQLCSVKQGVKGATSRFDCHTQSTGGGSTRSSGHIWKDSRQYSRFCGSFSHPSDCHSSRTAYSWLHS